jgi:hypothetical protein
LIHWFAFDRSGKVFAVIIQAQAWPLLREQFLDN